MATIVLNYDAKNPLAKPTLDYLQKVGFIKNNPTYSTSLDEALEDIQQGRVYTLCSRKTQKSV